MMWSMPRQWGEGGGGGRREQLENHNVWTKQATSELTGQSWHPQREPCRPHCAPRYGREMHTSTEAVLLPTPRTCSQPRTLHPSLTTGWQEPQAVQAQAETAISQAQKKGNSIGKVTSCLTDRWQEKNKQRKGNCYWSKWCKLYE